MTKIILVDDILCCLPDSMPARNYRSAERPDTIKCSAPDLFGLEQRQVASFPSSSEANPTFHFPDRYAKTDRPALSYLVGQSLLSFQASSILELQCLAGRFHDFNPARSSRDDRIHQNGIGHLFPQAFIKRQFLRLIRQVINLPPDKAVSPRDWSKSSPGG